MSLLTEYQVRKARAVPRPVQGAERLLLFLVHTELHLDARVGPQVFGGGGGGGGGRGGGGGGMSERGEDVRETVLRSKREVVSERWSF
jgi:hypothetical protein